MWCFHNNREIIQRVGSIIPRTDKNKFISKLGLRRRILEEEHSSCSQHVLRLSSTNTTTTTTATTAITARVQQTTSNILKPITEFQSKIPTSASKNNITEELANNILQGEKDLSKIYHENQKNASKINNTKLWKILQHDDIWISSFLKLQPRLDKISLERVMNMKNELVLSLYDNNNTTNTNTNTNSYSFSWIHNKVDYYVTTKKQYLNAFPSAAKVRIRRKRYRANKKKNKRIEVTNIPEPDYNNQKVLQEVIRKVLSCIYEPCFYQFSHGYRPGSGTSSHTALQDVRDNFNNCDYIIKGNISSYVGDDNMLYYYNMIQNILQKKINDKPFLKLIYDGCLAKVLFLPSFTGTNTEVTFYNPEVGSNNTIQQLNPLLWNIYLHEFDKFIHTTIMNDFYNSMLEEHQKNQIMKFVRYGDHFLIGLKNCDSHSKVLSIQENVTTFLNRQLNLHCETLLVDVTPGKYYRDKQHVPFLGYSISLHKGINQKGGVKEGRGRVVLKVDAHYLLHKLNLRGYCTKDGQPRPVFKFLHDPQNLTNDKINRLFAGLLEYYKLAENIRPFGTRLYYILSHSLAKMYAAKYRWHRRSTIFKLGGRDLGREIKKKRKAKFIPRQQHYKQQQDGGVEGANTTNKYGDTNTLFPPLKGIIYSHYNQIPFPIRSLNDPNFPTQITKATISFSNIYKGMDNHFFSLASQEISIVDELLGKFTTSGYKPKKIYDRTRYN